MIPKWSINIGGMDVTGRFEDKLLSLEVQDNEGTDSDSCTITVDDRDGKLPIPPTGDPILIYMGLSKLMPMGKFTVNEITLTGFPRQMTITGKSMDVKSELKEQRHQAYNDKTVKDIVSEIAKRHGLGSLVIGDLAKFKYTSMPQTGESDMNFLTRLAKTHDAISTIKNGKIIFSKKGAIDLGTIKILGANVKDYSCNIPDRPSHKESQGAFWDPKKVSREIEKQSGSGKKAIHQLGKYFSDGKKEAKEAANSKADELERSEKTIDLTVIGDPSIMAEMKVKVVGLRASVDGLYRIKNASHLIDSSGYQTQIQGELPK